MLFCYLLKRIFVFFAIIVVYVDVPCLISFLLFTANVHYFWYIGLKLLSGKLCLTTSYIGISCVCVNRISLESLCFLFSLHCVAHFITRSNTKTKSGTFLSLIVSILTFVVPDSSFKLLILFFSYPLSSESN